MPDQIVASRLKTKTTLSFLFASVFLTGMATSFAPLTANANNLSHLDFSVANTVGAKSAAKHNDSPDFFYRQQTARQISTFSNYEISKWFDLELDLKALKTRNDPTQTALNPKAYSAFANFGHAIDVSSERFRPFAKVGLGYEENRATYFNPNYIESDRINKTQLQYGLGVRYSRQNWKSFGVSFSYQSNSPLLEQTFGSSNTGFEKKDSIDLKFDFGF